jgi:Methylamine utilisation protein MauE
LSEVLTGPVLAASVLVCVSAVAKLRRPGGATRALAALGMPASRWVVRALCGVELATGVAALVAPGRVSLSALAGLYVVFAGASAALRGAKVGCGCFGESELAVTASHVAISGALAAACALGALWPPHGAAWVLGRPVLTVGIAGCVYALVLAYVHLPAAWGAWRAP